jgi:hypothetical protein
LWRWIRIQKIPLVGVDPGGSPVAIAAELVSTSNFDWGLFAIQGIDY